MNDVRRTIRHASVDEIDVVWALIQRAGRKLVSEGIRQWTAEYPNREVVAADQLRANLFVSTGVDGVVGCITLDGRPHAAYDGLPWLVTGPAMTVHRLCVDPMAERAGVARSLMEFAEARARVRRLRSMRLDVYPTNVRAMRLYESRGYRYVGDVQFPGRELRARCYELIL